MSFWTFSWMCITFRFFLYMQLFLNVLNFNVWLLKRKKRKMKGEWGKTPDPCHLQSLPLEEEGLATMAACLFFCTSIIRSSNQLRAQIPAAWRTEPRFLLLFFFSLILIAARCASCTRNTRIASCHATGRLRNG